MAHIVVLLQLLPSGGGIQGLRASTEVYNQGLGLWFPRDPSIQILPAWGPKVCKYYLHWAI